MKICVFAYNFKHKKTQETLIHLYLNNIKVHSIFAANKVKVKFKNSKIASTINHLDFVHPKKIAKKINSKYKIIQHDSKKLERILFKEKFDLGIIAGSRIIKKKIISKFRIGILNMHPGILPKNRGLDPHKWAILNNWPQGVTCHLINEKIDLGKLINKKIIKVFNDDTLVDINYRLDNTSLKEMIKAIKKLKKNSKLNFLKNQNNLHSTINSILEKKMLKNFKKYKKNYEKLI